MANYITSGLPNINLWIGDTSQSSFERFVGQTSDTGVIIEGLIGYRTVTYSEFTFESGGLTYRYLGSFQTTARNELVTGQVTASGTYDRIIVESGGQPIASVSGLSLNVDFGQKGALPPIDLAAAFVPAIGTLFAGDADVHAFANLHVNATPSLASIVFAGDDVLQGSAAADQLYGFGGSDYLYGSGGDDSLYGGAGNDFLFGGTGRDLLDGGADGLDVASYIDAASGVTASLLNPTINTGEAVGDAYVSVEALVGSRFADALVGDAAANSLYGLDGADYLYGLGGDDALIGGAGDDVLVGGAGNDALYGGDGNDWLESLGSGYEYFVGGRGNDTFRFSTSDLRAGDFLVIADFSETPGDRDGLIVQKSSPAEELVFIQDGSNLIVSTLTLGASGGAYVLNVTQAQLADQFAII